MEKNNEKESGLKQFFKTKGIVAKTSFLLDFLAEQNKDYAIKNTGSVKGKKNEKNRSGQSYLYKSLGMESEVLEIVMTDRVQGAALQQAVVVSIKRYPYLASKLIEKDGDFYFVHNDVSIIIKDTKKLRKLGCLSVNRHLIDITFSNKKIFVSFHHALCDGEGIKPFVETLLYYYCNTIYGKPNSSNEGIRLSNEPMLSGETDDPFLQRYEYNEKDFIKIDRNGFELLESSQKADKTDYRYELLIDSKEFLEVAKSNNATPSILVALIMAQAVKNIYGDFDKPIICNSALSMRKALGHENTFKNCVKSIALPYTKELSEKTLSEQAAYFRELLQAQRDADYLKKSANEFIGLYEKLDELNGYKEKQKIMSFFEKMQMNTYSLSYLGQFNLAGNEKYIESIFLYNSGVTGLGLTMVATNKHFCLVFKQSFKDNKYAKEFTKVIDSFNIKNKVSECIEFLTPTDALIKRKDN